MKVHCLSTVPHPPGPPSACQPLHRMRLLEPSFGGGAFVLAAVGRLLRAFKAAGGGADLVDCIRAVELRRSTFHATRQKIDALLLAQAFMALYNKVCACCIASPYPNFFPNQSVSVPTAFAQLHTAVLGVPFARDVVDLSGSFGSRTNKGALHWSY